MILLTFSGDHHFLICCILLANVTPHFMVQSSWRVPSLLFSKLNHKRYIPVLLKGFEATMTLHSGCLLSRTPTTDTKMDNSRMEHLKDGHFCGSLDTSISGLDAWSSNRFARGAHITWIWRAWALGIVAKLSADFASKIGHFDSYIHPSLHPSSILVVLFNHTHK